MSPDMGDTAVLPDADKRVANRQTILDHFRALERGDVHGALAAFAPDMINHRMEPGSAPGRDGLAQTLAIVLQCFPAATWHVESIVTDAENVVAKLVVEGEAHEMIMGVRAVGQRVAWRHIHWFRMSDGKIVEHDAIRDDRGLLRQLGMNVRGPHPGGLGGGLPGGNGAVRSDTGDRDPALTA